MSQKEKPKCKNLSPDELLQVADLFYPENEAFVVGKSKVLHPRATIFANIRFRKYGFPMRRQAFRTAKPQWKSSFVTLIMIIGLLLCVGIPVLVLDYRILFSDTQLQIETICYNLAGLPFLFFGFFSLFNIWKMLNFKQKDVRRDYTHLIQYGKLILGSVVAVDDKPERIVDGKGLPVEDNPGRITFQFLSPDTGKEIRGYWHFGRKALFREGDKVIVLYLDDQISIVL